jgi:hypothetical protein
MPYNGLGVFTPIAPPQYPAVPGTVILAESFNAIIEDLMLGLSNAIPRDGQAAPTGNLPMGGLRHTGVADGLVNGHYASYRQIKKTEFFVDPRDFGAVLNGVADDTAAIAAAQAHAIVNKRILVFNGVAHIATPLFLAAFVLDTMSQIFSVTSAVSVTSGQVIRPEWWGCDPSGSVECSANMNACLSNAEGRQVILSGLYRCDSPILISYANRNGLVLRGSNASLLNNGAQTYNRFGFNFNSCPAGQVCLNISSVPGLYMADFCVTHNTPGAVASEAVRVWGADQFDIQRLVIEVNAGVNAIGLKLGNTAAAPEIARNGSVRNCKIFANGGEAISISPGCYGILVEKCYQKQSRFVARSCRNCRFVDSSAENPPSYGFIFSGTTSCAAINCDGVDSRRGLVLLLDGAASTVIESPTSVNSNLDAFALPGDVVLMDGSGGAINSTTISKPISINSNAAAIGNVGAIGSVLQTAIYDTQQIFMPKGISGPLLWANQHLSISGDLELLAAFPVLNNMSATIQPTVTCTFTRKGKLVSFNILIIPNSPMTSFAGFDCHLLLPFGPLQLSSAIYVTDGVGGNLGYAWFETSGRINLPLFGPTSQVVTLSATVCNT